MGKIQLCLSIDKNIAKEFKEKTKIKAINKSRLIELFLVEWNKNNN